MKTINLSEYESFNFDFSIVQRLIDPRDRVIYKSREECEVFITSDTEFKLEVDNEELAPFEDVLKIMSIGDVKRLKSLDYKRQYVYEHELFNFEGYGAFPITIEFPELDRNSTSNLYYITFSADYVKINIKDLKKFLEFFKINLSITKPLYHYDKRTRRY